MQLIFTDINTLKLANCESSGLWIIENFAKGPAEKYKQNFYSLFKCQIIKLNGGLKIHILATSQMQMLKIK